jgi:hypothetical protein
MIDKVEQYNLATKCKMPFLSIIYNCLWDHAKEKHFQYFA